ncbi:MAG: hypothetical protein WDN31_08440 [Hyphomicrobium sp.]
MRAPRSVGVTMRTTTSMAAVGTARQIFDAADWQPVRGDELDRRPSVDGFEQARELVAMKAYAALARGGRLGERLLSFEELQDGGGVARDGHLDVDCGQ